jgi:stearoyl-CoA desaturase (delta-9 desaturase)
LRYVLTLVCSQDYRNGPRILDWDPTKWTIYLLHHFTPFVPVVHQVSESEILKARAHVLSVRSHKLSPHDDDKSSFAFWSSYASATSDDGADSVAGYGSSASDSDDAVSSLLSGSVRRRRAERTSGGLPIWTEEELISNLDAMNNAPASSDSSPRKRPLVLVIDGYAIDATTYAKSHPGGMALLHRFAVSTSKKEVAEGEAVKMSASEAFGGGLNNHGWSAKETMKSLRVAKIVR